MSNTSAVSRVRAIGTWVLLGLMTGAGIEAQIIERFSTPLSPGRITLGPDGAMWFTERGPKIGRIDAQGAVRDLPIPSAASDIALGSDGNLWVTTRDGIGRLTPAGAFTLFPVAGTSQIASGPDGNLWFTEDPEPRLGRITPSGTITEFPLPSISAARHLASGPDGNLWFTKPDDKVGRITPSGDAQEFGTPTPHVWPFDIAAGPDGNVWFTQSSGLARITPDGTVTEYPDPDVQALATGTDGYLWAAGFGTLKRVAPDGTAVPFAVPTGTSEFFASVPSMAAAPDGSIWIADPNNSQIVRFAPDTTACAPDPTTLCLGGGRFRVTATWKSGNGSTGDGRAVALTAGSGYFWFFDPANLEVVVKVLDGCSINGHHWAFAAGLTNLEVKTTVTDTFSGFSRTYTNPQGAAFASVQDTATFAECE